MRYTLLRSFFDPEAFILPPSKDLKALMDKDPLGTSLYVMWHYNFDREMQSTQDTLAVIRELRRSGKILDKANENPVWKNISRQVEP
jgi:hypothetical protein